MFRAAMRHPHITLPSLSTPDQVMLRAGRAWGQGGLQTAKFTLLHQAVHLFTAVE